MLRCVMDRLLWRSTGHWTWLNLLSVHPWWSTLYRFQSGQRSARRPTFKSGHLKAQGSARSPLRSKSFMTKKCLAWLILLFSNLGRVPFARDKPCPGPHAPGAARGIGRCRSATRAPGRPWIAEASRPVPTAFGAGLSAEGWLRKPRPKAKNSSSPFSDLLWCSYVAGDLRSVFRVLCGLGFPGWRRGRNCRCLRFCF